MGGGTHPEQELVLRSVPSLQGTGSRGLCLIACSCLSVCVEKDR